MIVREWESITRNVQMVMTSHISRLLPELRHSGLSMDGQMPTLPGYGVSGCGQEERKASRHLHLRGVHGIGWGAGRGAQREHRCHISVWMSGLVLISFCLFVGSCGCGWQGSCRGLPQEMTYQSWSTLTTNWEAANLWWVGVVQTCEYGMRCCCY